MKRVYTIDDLPINTEFYLYYEQIKGAICISGFETVIYKAIIINSRPKHLEIRDTWVSDKCDEDIFRKHSYKGRIDRPDLPNDYETYLISEEEVFALLI